MKVLVTGCAGFLGSHVSEWYRNNGHEVVGIDNFTTYELDKYEYSSKIARDYMKNFLKDLNIEVLEWDISKPFPSIPDNLRDIDYLIHCAAQPTMTLSIENPRLDFDTNAQGTFNMLELARALDIPMVNCSTIHVYGNNSNKELIEDKTRFIGYNVNEDYNILDGDISPLHASKRSSEIYVDSYISTYGLKGANFRLTGMYGERQFAGIHHGWVSNFAIRTLFGRPITIYGSDKQVRDILYAKDACCAFAKFYIHQEPGTYNIGGGIRNSISIRECLDYFREITGKQQDITYKAPRYGDLWHFVCDITKAKDKLRWKPMVSKEEGLKILVNWIKQNKQLFEVKS